jgi:hypothetical protein
MDACDRLAQRYGVKVAAIIGHREVPSGKRQGKTCPGFDVALLRRAITARRAGAADVGRPA